MIAVLHRGRRPGRIGRSGASPDAGVPDARTGAEPYERKSSTKIRPRLESRRKRSGSFRASFARVEKSGLWAIIEPEQSRSSRRREAHVRDVHVRKREEARRADPCGNAFRAGRSTSSRFVPSSVRISFDHGPARAGHPRKIPAMYPHNPHLLSTNVSITVACGEVVHRHSACPAEFRKECFS